MQVLDDRALQTRPACSRVTWAFANVIDLDVRQSFGAVNFHEFAIGINFAAGQTADLSRTTRNAQTDDTPILQVGCAGEHLEVHIGHDVGQFGELKLDPKIGLVGAIAVHCFAIGHHRKLTQIDAHRVLEDSGDHALHQIANVLFSQKGGFNIDLCELGLAVGTQVFITETFGELVIAVIAGNHQQLLEQLRALRQGKKVSIMNTAGHQVVTCTFRSGLAEHRRFNVDEAMGIKVLSHFHGDAVTQHQVVLHVGTAQVQYAVRQTCRLTQTLVIELKRRRHRRVEYGQLMAQHLDLATLETLVDGAGRA